MSSSRERLEEAQLRVDALEERLVDLAAAVEQRDRRIDHHAEVFEELQGAVRTLLFLRGRPERGLSRSPVTI